MNRRYSAVAASALALGALAPTATEALARVEPDPTSRNTTPLCNYPNHPVCVVVPAADPVEMTLEQSASEGDGTDVLRVGALGSAGLAFGGLWLYRRRRLQAI